MKKSLVKLIVLALIAVVLFILGARFLSGEDSWMCNDGQWVKHGNPSLPMPTSECK
jgi:hypothetical protein